jgi:hypothetical protein
MAFGDRFLVHPDLFPARQGGAAWGTEGATLEIAGGPYRLSGMNEPQARAVHGRFAERCAAPAVESAPAVEVRLFQVSPAEFRGPMPAGWEYTLDLAYQPQAVTVAGFHWMGRLDWAPVLGAALWTATEDESEFLSVIENFLRILVAYRMVECGGATLHSAAILDGPGAYVFFGPSGSGKSTITGLAARAQRAGLSDDLNAIYVSDTECTVQQIPFAGDFGQTSAEQGRYRLLGAYRLCHGTSLAAHPLAEGNALAKLMACAPYVNADPYRCLTLSRNLEALMRRVPVAGLSFLRDSAFDDIVRCVERRA